jgi:hypothetical protein
MFFGTDAFNQALDNFGGQSDRHVEHFQQRRRVSNKPIGSWETAAVTNTVHMLTDASAFNQPLGNWSTAAVTNMESMFERARNFNQALGNWNMAAVTNMESMFQGASAYRGHRQLGHGQGDL